MLAGSCSAEFGSLRFGGGKFFWGEKQNGGGNRGRNQGRLSFLSKYHKYLARWLVGRYDVVFFCEGTLTLRDAVMHLFVLQMFGELKINHKIP